MRVQHLRKRAEFVSLSKTGDKAASYGLVLQTKPLPEQEADTEEYIRLGFTVTKQVGNAVIRNRVKRRLRAAAREVMPVHAKPYHDYVMIGRQGTITRPFADLVGDIKYTLKRINAYKGK